MASNTYFVKVLSVEERETTNGEVVKYKHIEAVQEVGWWLNKFSFNLFPNHTPFETVTVGDKLFLRARDFNDWQKHTIYAFRTNFEECRKCHAYNKNPEHVCPPQNDSIRISGQWTIESLYRKPNTNLVKLLLGQKEEHIGFSKFSNVPNEFYEGEVLNVSGWQRQENRHNALVVNKIK